MNNLINNLNSNKIHIEQPNYDQQDKNNVKQFNNLKIKLLTKYIKNKNIDLNLLTEICNLLTKSCTKFINNILAKNTVENDLKKDILSTDLELKKNPLIEKIKDDEDIFKIKINMYAIKNAKQTLMVSMVGAIEMLYEKNSKKIAQNDNNNEIVTKESKPKKSEDNQSEKMMFIGEMLNLLNYEIPSVNNNLLLELINKHKDNDTLLEEINAESDGENKKSTNKEKNNKNKNKKNNKNKNNKNKNIKEEKTNEIKNSNENENKSTQISSLKEESKISTDYNKNNKDNTKKKVIEDVKKVTNTISSNKKQIETKSLSEDKENLKEKTITPSETNNLNKQIISSLKSELEQIKNKYKNLNSRLEQKIKNNLNIYLKNEDLENSYSVIMDLIKHNNHENSMLRKKISNIEKTGFSSTKTEKNPIIENLIEEVNEIENSDEYKSLLEYIENLKENFEEKNYNQNDIEIINNFNDIENNNKNIVGVKTKKHTRKNKPKISDLQTEIEKTKKEYENLNSKLEQTKKENSDISYKNNVLESNYDMIMNWFKDSAHENDMLKEKLSDLEKKQSKNSNK